MELIEGLKWLAKICKSQPRCNGDCPLRQADGCWVTIREPNPVVAAQLIEDYAAAHPVKTYKDVFLDAFPRACGDNLALRCCVATIFRGRATCDSFPDCATCWNQPYEEDTNG